MFNNPNSTLDPEPETLCPTFKDQSLLFYRLTIFVNPINRIYRDPAKKSSGSSVNDEKASNENPAATS